MYYKKELIEKAWSEGLIFSLYGKEYYVHRMSYGDYFIEPVEYQGSETKGFSKKTKWFEKVLLGKTVHYKIKETK